MSSEVNLVNPVLAVRVYQTANWALLVASVVIICAGENFKFNLVLRPWEEGKHLGSIKREARAMGRDKRQLKALKSTYANNNNYSLGFIGGRNYLFVCFIL